MATAFSILLAIVIVLVWFLVFSEFSWLTRIATLVLVVGLPIAVSNFAIRKVEYGGAMRPIIYWFWEPDPSKALAQRLAEEKPDSTGQTKVDLTVGGADFAEYRGPKRDGVAHGLGFNPAWSAKPPKVLWKQAAGGGYAGFAVAGRAPSPLNGAQEKEAIVCYDRASGKEIWVHAYPAAFRQSEPMGGDGPRATPTIAEGDVFSLGALGDLVCLEGKTGKQRWQVNILTDCKAKNVQWGMSGSPRSCGATRSLSIRASIQRKTRTWRSPRTIARRANASGPQAINRPATVRR